MATTFFILAGEASGDLHGAKLVSELRALAPAARTVGMGGPRMAAAGLEVAKDLDGMAVMGFWEVARRLGFFRRVFAQLLDRVKQERPSALICIDYPGFNLRFARAVQHLGIPVCYYILPQVWAWKPARAVKMAEIVDRAFCVFDFEPPFFQRFCSPRTRMKTRFVGHPLLDQPPPPGLALPPGGRTVALLPGSRAAEYHAHGAPFCAGFARAQRSLTGLRGLLSVGPGFAPRDGAGLFAGPPADGRAILCSPPELAEACAPALADAARQQVSHARLLPAAADFAVVKSGTSTLEAALAGKPLCVAYRSGWINYAIARLLVNLPVFSLVNIVLGRCAVPELLQSEVNEARIAAEIERGLTDAAFRERQQAALAELPGRLGGPGASRRAAQGILDFLNGRE